MSFTAFFKDKNLKPENIRKGVKIGRVKGTLEGGGGSGNNQNITADSSTLEQIFEAEEGYDGIGVFTLLPYVLDTKTVNSSTVSQTVNSSVDGLSSVTVNPYVLDTKTVDSSTVSQTVNSSADGLSSVTVNPYVLDTKSLDPSTVSQTVNSSADGMSSVSISAVTSSIDANIQAENIKSGVTILGVTGNVTSGDWVAGARKLTIRDLSSKTLTASSSDNNYRYSNLLSRLGSYSYSNTITPPTLSGTGTSSSEFYSFLSNSYIEFPLDNNNEYTYTIPFSSISSDGMSECFRNANLMRNSKIYFPNLTTIGSYGFCKGMYYCTGSLSVISMPNLATIEQYGMQDAFSYYSLISTVPDFISSVSSIGYRGMYNAFYCGGSQYPTGAVNFTNLSSLSSEGLYQTFANRTGITSASFPALILLNDTCFGYTFQNCTSLTSASFPEVTGVNYTSGSSPFLRTFEGCTSLTSVNFPKLNSLGNFGFDYTFEDCTSLTSVSFPELTTCRFNYSFSGCNRLNSISFPKLNTRNLSSIHLQYPFGGCKNLFNADINWQGLNIINYNIPIKNLTLEGYPVNDDITLSNLYNLSKESVQDVISKLDLNTSGKTVTFYTNGINVDDDYYDTLQGLCDDAVNAGWTINNLTINPLTITVTYPSSKTLVLDSSNVIEFESASAWTATTSSNDITLDSYSGSAGASNSITVTVPSGWNNMGTISITDGTVTRTINITKDIEIVSKLVTNKDYIEVAPINDVHTVVEADIKTTSYPTVFGNKFLMKAEAGTAPGAWELWNNYNSGRYVFGISSWNSTFNTGNTFKNINNIIKYIAGVYNDDYLHINLYDSSSWSRYSSSNSTVIQSGITDNLKIGSSDYNIDITEIKVWTGWSGDDGGSSKTLVHDYVPGVKNGVYGLFDAVGYGWYPCANGLVTGIV